MQQLWHIVILLGRFARLRSRPLPRSWRYWAVRSISCRLLAIDNYHFRQCGPGHAVDLNFQLHEALGFSKYYQGRISFARKRMAAAPITLPTTTRASMTDQNDYDDACFGFERC